MTEPSVIAKDEASPDLLGHPADETNATHLLRVGSGYYFQTEHSTAVYVGLLPLLLAGIVLLAPGDHRRVALVGLSLAALGLLWCMCTPLTALGPWIPGLGFSRPDRATFVWCFGAENMSYHCTVGAVLGTA